jgi:hypothetical protein
VAKKIPIAVSSDAQGCGETVGVTRLARQATMSFFLLLFISLSWALILVPSL